MLEILDPLPVPKFALSAPEKQKKTESTLLYEVIQEGTGKTPKVTDKVLVHYAGWLTNGTLFDSSFQRGEPTELGLNQVIPGWREGLMLMKEGAVYKFTIPPDLAYGAGGAPPTIGPNATLVFHLELKKVK
ncbi:MAG: FKBP-type peptidyl-prolyl cis-trans isomerase [Planctomycetes bacterium]|nr:FKBP-type peptidyl-prolyl cis-trans isomerase [Planctomycetota bacterium]